MVRYRLLFCCIVFLTGYAAQDVAAQPLRLVPPTNNDALFRGDYAGYFQFTDRTFDGEKSNPWQAGQYGFVRNPRVTDAGIIYTRFHEGLDIRPVYRDARGEPLDTVRTVDDGRVVYVNANPRESNYGIYVVVEHWWSGSPFYSLYAHLGRANVREGQQVRRGDRLGIMGYTGRGIDRRRAHVHFEINMLANRNFEQWHDAHFRPGSNHHRIYNGLNLVGLDAAALLLAHRKDPSLTIEEFVQRQEPYFKVIVPDRGPLDLLYRYPWLLQVERPSQTNAWEITFTRTGLPIRVVPSPRRVGAPEILKVVPSDIPYDDVSHLLAGDRVCVLSQSGLRFLDLLMQTEVGGGFEQTSSPR